MPAAPTAPRYVTDEAGNRTAVLLDLAEYRRLADAAEELADVRAFDAAKASGEDRLPLAEAFAEVDRRRAGDGVDGSFLAVSLAEHRGLQAPPKSSTSPVASSIFSPKWFPGIGSIPS